MLSKEDVKALRMAKKICLYCKHGEAEIVAENGNTTTSIKCRNLSHFKNGYNYGFGWIPSAQVSRHWKTIVSLIKPGDVLGIEFDQDAFRNGYCEKADLHHDICNLIVYRKNKELVFLVDTSVCPDNQARMIQKI